MSSEEVDDLAVVSHLGACRSPAAPGVAAEAAVGGADGSTGIAKEPDNDITTNKKEVGNMDTLAVPPQQRGVSEADEKKNPALLAEMELHGSLASQSKKKGSRDQASKADLAPQRYENNLAFMFESRYVIEPTQYALSCSYIDNHYMDCWDSLEKKFTGKK